MVKLSLTTDDSPLDPLECVKMGSLGSLPDFKIFGWPKRLGRVGCYIGPVRFQGLKTYKSSSFFCNFRSWVLVHCLIDEGGIITLNITYLVSLLCGLLGAGFFMSSIILFCLEIFKLSFLVFAVAILLLIFASTLNLGEPNYCWSGTKLSTWITPSNLNKANTLLFWEQFGDKVSAKVLKLVKAQLPEHNALCKEVKEALEPFIPELVAEKLGN